MEGWTALVGPEPRFPVGMGLEGPQEQRTASALAMIKVSKDVNNYSAVANSHKVSDRTKHWFIVQLITETMMRVLKKILKDF